QQRLGALAEEHQKGIIRFQRRLVEFESRSLLTSLQRSIVEEHLLRLGERNRNPANTGNIEDLFCYTLADTRDPIRAFAQALADTEKVVPMDESASLYPVIRNLDGQATYTTVGQFAHLNPGDKMLVTHTMVAYGDEEICQHAIDFVRATRKELDKS